MTFNSKEYNWCDLRTFILGREVGGIRGIEYKKKITKEVLFGAGNKPRAVQHGKREYDGTITLLQSEFIALNTAAMTSGYEDIMDVEFDVIVTYLAADGTTLTDSISGVSITELPHSMKEGDMFMEIALPFIALDVKHGA